MFKKLCIRAGFGSNIRKRLSSDGFGIPYFFKKEWFFWESKKIYF